jgi:surfactin family lipopeptide synthetase A/fengycin family lipopeptide synthetase D
MNVYIPPALGAYYPALPAQRHIYALARQDDTGVAYNRPFMAEVGAELDLKVLQHAFEALISRHEAFRTGFRMAEGSLMQLVFQRAPAEIEFEPEYHAEAGFIRPFDLSRAPLLRLRLIQQNSRSLILLDIHCLVADEETALLALRELLELYGGETLPPPPQFKDYSEWLLSADMSLDAAYWRDTLLNIGKVACLSPDFQPPGASLKAKALSRVVPIETRRGVLRLISSNTTEYAVLMACLLLLAAIYGRTADTAAYGFFSARDRLDSGDAAGMYGNMAVVRCRFGRGDSFLQVLSQVAESVVNAAKHQDCLPEAPADQPPMLALFLRGADPLSQRAAGLKADIRPMQPAASPFAIALYVTAGENGYLIRAVYRASLFEEKTVEEFLRRYETVLAAAVNTPEAPVESLEVLSAAERENVLVNFNASRVPFDTDDSAVSLFLRQAWANPDAVALEYRGGCITYSQLNRRVNAVAWLLISENLAAEDLVAVYAARGAEMFIAALGVLKAGAAFVPIDASSPETRVQYILSDASPKAVLLANASLPAGVSVDARVYSISEAPLKDQEFTANPPYCCSARGLACCFYTHDEGDRPRGVMIEHRALVNLTQYYLNQAAGPANHRILQCSDMESTGFLNDLCGGLLAGTPLRLTPWLGGGGWQSPAEYLPAIKPEGRPVCNTSVYILNGQRLCGTGMPGEVCLAGPGIARGYLHNPELTARRFTPNPFGPGKVFHTGDLARWLPDGRLEYLGKAAAEIETAAETPLPISPDVDIGLLNEMLEKIE